MKYKLNKNTAFGGGLCLKYSLAIPFITACSYADMPKEVLTEIHNKLCYVDWAITAHKKLQQAEDDDFFKEPKRKVSKYRESIVNVIGHAIADCVTRQKEFANTKDDGQSTLITFEANPLLYSKANWNAVILYNLVENVLHSDSVDAKYDEFNIQLVFEDIYDKLLDHYKGYGIKNLEGKLKDAINDIAEYEKRLDLARSIREFYSEKDPSKIMTVANHRYVTSVLEKQYNEAVQNGTTVKLHLNRTVSLNPDHSTTTCAVQFNVTLQYAPNAVVGEQWSLNDNNSFVFQEFERTKQGGYKTVCQFFNPNYFNWLLQFIECDLELDASKERDWHYWGRRGCYFEYKGKEINIPSINKNNSLYAQLKYDPNDKNMIERYYTSYKTIDPKKRPLPVAE